MLLQKSHNTITKYKNLKKKFICYVTKNNNDGISNNQKIQIFLYFKTSYV